MFSFTNGNRNTIKIYMVTADSEPFIPPIIIGKVRVSGCENFLRCVSSHWAFQLARNQYQIGAVTSRIWLLYKLRTQGIMPPQWSQYSPNQFLTQYYSVCWFQFGVRVSNSRTGNPRFWQVEVCLIFSLPIALLACATEEELLKKHYWIEYPKQDIGRFSRSRLYSYCYQVPSWHRARF